MVEKCEAGNHEEEAARDLITNGVDGIILPPPLCDSASLIDLIAKSTTPAVAVACGQPDQRVSAVSIDDYHAAYAMTRHLVALGHHRLGFIIGHPNQTASARRLAGFKAALKDSGTPHSADLVVQGLFTYRSGLDAAETLLGLDPPPPPPSLPATTTWPPPPSPSPTAWAWTCPGDLTVAGFDDTALAITIWPELTTVRQPIAAMAEAAVNLLVRHIKARRNNEPEPPEHIVMDFKLIRRQSDAAPRLRPAYEDGGAGVALADPAPEARKISTCLVCGIRPPRRSAPRLSPGPSALPP